MSTEMSSVKSAPSSSAPSCFDREISLSPTLTDRGRIDESLCESLPRRHIYSSSRRCSEHGRQSDWLPVCSCWNQAEWQSVEAHVTYSVHSLFVPHKPNDKWPNMYVNRFWTTTACWLHCIPWGQAWATDNSVLANGRWGGGRGGCEAGLKAAAEGHVLQAGGQTDGCAEWLAPALEAPDGKARACASGVRGPMSVSASAVGVRILAGLRCSASHHHSTACSHEDGNSSWARDESK